MNLTDFASIIITPAGSLFYELSILLLLTVFLVVVRSLAETSNPTTMKRWTIAASILLASHLLLTTLLVFSWLQLIDENFITPILERYSSILAIILFAWVLFFPTPQQRGDRSALIAISLITVGGFITLINVIMNGIPSAFNTTLADAIWGFTGLLTAGLCMLAMVIQRPKSWTYAAFGFAIILIGYLLHLTLGPLNQSLMVFVRWGNLIGYLLLIIAAIRSFSIQLIVEPDEESIDPSAKITYETEYFSLPQVLNDLEEMMDSNQFDALVPSTVRGVGRIMKAEISLLFTSPDPPEHFAIAQGYDLISERFIQGEGVNAQQMPVVVNALRQHRSLILPAQSRAPDILEIRNALNLEYTGPILLAPMVSEDNLQGGIMLLSPFARKRWSEGSRHSLEHITDIVADRFRELERAQEVGRDEEAPGTTEMNKLLDQIVALEAENVRLMEQLSLLASTDDYDIQGILQLQNLAEDTINMLEADVDRLKAVVAEQPGLPSSEETEQITDQLQHVLQELAVSRAKLSQFEQSEGKPSITKEVSPDVKAITAIAQDLRRPMASILGYTDLLLGETAGDLSPTQEEFLTHVRESTVIMTTMLNDLVHVTAIETGTLDLIPVPVDFLKVIDNSVDQTSTALRKKKVALRMDFPNIMPTVLGDEDALLQIVVHLLNNAIGVSPEEGEIAIVVRRTSMETDQFLTLMIVDQGGGIPPEDISRVFDPVYKTEGLTIIGTSESGMGLSIVRALMEAMGGRVWADSKLGSGSTFTALIPLAGAST